MRRADPVVIYVQHRSVMAGVLHDEVLFRFKPTAEGFTARRDRRRAFTLLRRMSRRRQANHRGVRRCRLGLPGCRGRDDLGGVLGAQVRRSRSTLTRHHLLRACADLTAVRAGDAPRQTTERREPAAAPIARSRSPRPASPDAIGVARRSTEDRHFTAGRSSCRRHPRRGGPGHRS